MIYLCIFIAKLSPQEIYLTLWLYLVTKKIFFLVSEDFSDVLSNFQICNAILLTVNYIPMTYFITGNLYFFAPSLISLTLVLTSGSHRLFSVSVSLVFLFVFFWIIHVSEIIQYLSFSPSGSFSDVTNGKIS